MNKFTILFAAFLFFSINSVNAQNSSKQKTELCEFVIDYNVLIYPNPVVNNNFYVKSTEIIKTIEVMNVLGKNIKTIHNETGVAYNIYVELDNVEEGMYMVRVTFTSGKSIIKKIILK